MKKALSLILALVMCLSLCACGTKNDADEKKMPDLEQRNMLNPTEQEEQSTEPEKIQPDAETAPETEPEPEPEPEVEVVPEVQPEPQKVTMGIADFENLLLEMPVFVKSHKYVVQDEKYKALYPDMLQAVLQNNTIADIKNAVVAFVAWDKNSLPIKIKGSSSYSDGAYIQEVSYNDINLIPGETYGESSGYSVDEDCGIETFQAIVVSFESFDGDTWENPYYNAWRALYEGVKYNDDLSTEFAIVDIDFETTEKIGNPDDTDGTDATMQEEELLAQIEQQEVRVVKTKYVVQDTRFKSLYPDMLQAILQNDSSYDIKNAVVAFVAWDKNNLPVKIKGSWDYSDGAYIQQVAYNDINLIPGETYGKSSGYEIDEDCGIETFQAIVVSYETFDGETWDNPCYDAWCALYEGAKKQ